MNMNVDLQQCLETLKNNVFLLLSCNMWFSQWLRLFDLFVAPSRLCLGSKTTRWLCEDTGSKRGLEVPRQCVVRHSYRPIGVSTVPYCRPYVCTIFNNIVNLIYPVIVLSLVTEWQSCHNVGICCYNLFHVVSLKKCDSAAPGRVYLSVPPPQGSAVSKSLLERRTSGFKDTKEVLFKAFFIIF